MGFIYAILVWLVMAAVLGVGMVLAVKGSGWLLVISIIVFIVLVGKIGCLSH